jgi:hypothetical protein
MNRKLPFEVHPAADLFPYIEGDDFKALVEDIRENGVNEPIAFWNGKLLDGRNRSMACLEIGIDPLNHAIDIDPETDPVAYVMSANLHRRHLTTGQRAAIGVKLKGDIEEKAKERKGSNQHKSKVETLPPSEVGKSRDIVGQTLNVSGKSIDAAVKILRSGDDEVIAAVESGKMSLNAALRKIKQKADPQPVQKKLTKQQAAEKRKALDNADRKPPKTKGEPADPEPKHPVASTDSELFAIAKVDAAIAELKCIPFDSEFREYAFDRLLMWSSAQKRLPVRKKVGGSRSGVSVDSGPIDPTDSFASTPRDKWKLLVWEKRDFLQTRLTHDCRCLVEFCKEASEVWQELGYESADDMVRNGFELDPQEIKIAVAWLRINEPEAVSGLDDAFLDLPGNGGDQ